MPKAKPKPTKKPAAKKPAEVRAPAPVDPLRQMSGTVALDRIRPSPLNPRKSFPEESIAGLAASIEEIGLQQPLIVRPVPLTADFAGGQWVGLDHYELVDGERRYRALALLSEKTRAPLQVPVSVRWLTDDQVLTAAIVANDQREDVRPSEQAAGYARLAEGRTAEAVAALVGKSVGFVRGLLRLARLPAWALAAVDAGILSRATAELVARVPGDESRKKAAGCVLLGCESPRELDGEWNENDTWEVAAANESGSLIPDEVLSYRDTRRLIAAHFQKELKTAPFSRKSLNLLVSAGSCDTCPKRAGNDPEAKAEGVRADICLDPDCYREKVMMHDTAELTKGTRLGALAAPEDFAWPSFLDTPPKGYCDLEEVAARTELGPELGAIRDAAKPLRELLRLDKHSPGNGLHWYVALDRSHKKGRLVIKTATARAELVRLGVLTKPEPRQRTKPPAATPSTNAGSDSPTAATESRNSIARCEKCKATFDAAGRSKCPSCSVALAPLLVSKVDEWDIDEKAVKIAAAVIGEYTEDAADDLRTIEASEAFPPLAMIARFLVRDHCKFGPERRKHVEAAFPDVKNHDYESAVKGLNSQQLIALSLRLVAGVVLDGEAGAAKGFGRELLDWAELDWPQLQDQARRVLSGEPSADEKIAAAEEQFA